MNIKKFEMQSYRDSIGGVVSSIENLPYEGFLIRMGYGENYIFGLNIKNKEHSLKIIKEIGDKYISSSPKNTFFVTCSPFLKNEEIFIETLKDNNYIFHGGCARMFLDKSKEFVYPTLPTDYTFKEVKPSSNDYRETFIKCFSSGINKITEEGKKTLLESLQKKEKENKNLHYVLYEKDLAIGLFCIGKDFVGDVGIIPEYQGKGLGSSLLQFAIKKYLEEYNGELSLTTKQDINGNDFIKFYEKNGFYVSHTLNSWKKN